MKTLVQTLFVMLTFYSVQAAQNQISTTQGESGNVIITHSNTYGPVNILETSKIKVEKNREGYKIHGSWWTHDADIHDGFHLTIKSSDELRHDLVASKESTKRTFKIPEEATLLLSYDPMLPYYEDNDSDFKRAVTDDYQTYDVSKGSVTIDVLAEGAIQVSFNGKVSLRKIIRHSNSSEDYTETFFESSVIGGIDSNDVMHIVSQDMKVDRNTNRPAEVPNENFVSNGSAATPGVYHFNFETDIRITSPEQKEVHIMSYLLNNKESYFGIKTNMSDYTDEEMGGEAIVVMDKDAAHFFVETAGMKIQMSPNTMGGEMKNPSDQMMDYDYSNLSKTGNTKEVLGATCYEYIMSNDGVKMTLWVAPSVNLPNWFVQNQELFQGFIMEYTVDNNGKSMKSEVIAIHDNRSKTIDPAEYQKMF